MHGQVLETSANGNNGQNKATIFQLPSALADGIKAYIILGFSLKHYAYLGLKPKLVLLLNPSAKADGN